MLRTILIEKKTRLNVLRPSFNCLRCALSIGFDSALTPVWMLENEPLITDTAHQSNLYGLVLRTSGLVLRTSGLVLRTSLYGL